MDDVQVVRIYFRSKGLAAELTYSPDDNGWYYDIYNHHGENIERNDGVFTTKEQAKKSIHKWVRLNA